MQKHGRLVLSETTWWLVDRRPVTPRDGVVVVPVMTWPAAAASGGDAYAVSMLDVYGVDASSALNAYAVDVDAVNA
jgi:hypothetical protein